MIYAPLPRLTLGITAFNRPECLEKLVASVREYHPQLPILVADNGWLPADLSGWAGVTMVQVDQDCGLSASRNALVAACPTEFMVLAEEDFVFDQRTDLAAALSVIESDPDLGMIGGSLETARQLQHYARNFRELEAAEGEVLRAVPAGGPMRTTSGVLWRPCDMVFNWGIFRVAMAQEVPWDHELKLAEHVDWFYRLHQTGWKIGHTPALVCRHEREEPGDYARHRQRAASYLEQFRQKHNLARFEHTAAADEPLRASRPVIIMGIGHSGTSVLSKMLASLGFYDGPADQEYGEHVGIREVNEEALATGQVDLSRGLDHLEDLASPWVLKDPRFVHTLSDWLPILGRWEPLLVWVVRDDAEVAASYQRRGENFRGGRTLSELYAMAEGQFEAWPFGKIRVTFENIAAAVSLFDLGRAGVERGRPSRPVPPQAEPRVVSPASYDGEPGGPCVCTEPGRCRRHPAIHKVGRLFDICQGTVLTPDKCEEYRLAWDAQHEVEQVIEPSHQVPNNTSPADCRHRGELLRTSAGGG